MRITSKGQVTIPAHIREAAGLLPDMDVKFEYDGEVVRLMRAEPGHRESRGASIVARLSGTGQGTMTTDEILALMRGED